MGIKYSIPFTNPAQHTYDATKIKVADGAASLMELYPLTEQFYYNFDVDGGTLSKRGQKEITLFGNDNNGVIQGGNLVLAGLLDSAAKREGIVLATPNQIAGKVGFIGKTTAFSGAKQSWRVQNTTDQSMFNIYISWQGGGVYRVYFQVIDATGTALYNQIIGAITATGTDPFHVAYSYAKGGIFTVFFNGYVFAAIDASAWDVNFSTVDMFWGDYTGGNPSYVDFDNTQFINEDYFNGESTVDTGEVYSYERTYQKIVTNVTMLMEGFEGFTPDYSIESAGDIMHSIYYGVIEKYIDTALPEWKNIANPSTDINSSTEINSYASLLEFPEGSGKDVKFASYIRSTDGFESPQIVTLNSEYTPFGSCSLVVPTCNVRGLVTSVNGVVLPGAVIRFIYPPKAFGAFAKLGSAVEVFTDAIGQISEFLVITETEDYTITIVVEYQSINEKGKRKTITEVHTGRTIPNITEVCLATILKAP